MVARIYIWKTLVGAVLWDNARNLAITEFDKDFIKKGWDIAPVTMPLAEQMDGKRIFTFGELPRETFLGLPGLLIDSLPDKFGNKLIDAWLARNGKNPADVNAVERLCYTGKRGMGALEFEPSNQPDNRPSSPMEIEELVQLARAVLDEREGLRTNVSNRINDGLLEIVRVGTSAGGARAKAVIAYNQQTGDVRSGQVEAGKGFDYWIIKFDGVTNQLLGDPKGYGRIEYAYYLMALDCGIEMMESRLLKEKEYAHFMTKRFDRTEGNGKLHMQTLCAMAHFDYNNPDAYSYEQAFQTMRLLRLPYTDAKQLYTRMVFNVLARNCDDHTKNISFLMDQTGTWKLSPAYDVTYAFDPNNKWMKRHQLSVNGKREGITREDLLTVAREMNIKKAEDIIEQVSNAINNWNEYAQRAEIPVAQAKGLAETFVKL